MLRPGGATVTGAVLNHTPNGLGGGVQYLNDVAGGAVWVSQPAGQGLDAQFTTYDAASLAVLGSYTGTVTSSVVDTGRARWSWSSPAAPRRARRRRRRRRASCGSTRTAP